MMMNVSKMLVRILRKYHTALAWLAVLACLFTWYLDLANHVHACPYCRVERTIIGILGVIALLPKHQSVVLCYMCYLLAFFGADIAGDQVFLSIKAGTFPTLNAMFASLGFIFIGVLTVINHYRYASKHNKS